MHIQAVVEQVAFARMSNLQRAGGGGGAGGRSCWGGPLAHRLSITAAATAAAAVMMLLGLRGPAASRLRSQMLRQVRGACRARRRWPPAGTEQHNSYYISLHTIDYN